MTKKLTLAQKAAKRGKSVHRTRKIDGRIYHYVASGNSKATLQGRAESIRKSGRHARVIPSGKKSPRWDKYYLMATKRD